MNFKLTSDCICTDFYSNIIYSCAFLKCRSLSISSNDPAMHKLILDVSLPMQTNRHHTTTSREAPAASFLEKSRKGRPFL